MKVSDPLLVAGPLFKCIGEVTERSVDDAKVVFRRTRPYKLPSNGLKFLKDLKEDDSFSYPSGHAAYGAAVGLVLAEMIPEERDKIAKRVQDYGFSRMVAGVHFRSDVYAGEIAGAAIAMSLFKSGEFREAFDSAKAELRKALGH